MAAQSLLVAGAETALGNISRAGESALPWAPGAVGMKALDIFSDKFYTFPAPDLHPKRYSRWTRARYGTPPCRVGKNQN